MLSATETLHHRQLAAIMFADIEGYTAMMQHDEKKALSNLMRFREGIEMQSEQYHGRVIQFYGDGCLLVFNSAIEAIRCAMSFQRIMLDDQVAVRIGIHQGDIIHGDGNIYGDSVNIASRVESMSLPGAILVSEKVRDELHNQPDITFVSLGAFHFKNVKEPMQVYAIAGEPFTLPLKREISGKFKTQSNKKSIAVLAFENRSSDPEQEYFSDGIAEDIIYGLSRLENLKVAGRATSFAFKQTGTPIRDIGKQLEVESVLEGSIRKMGNRVRVSVQLVNAVDGFQIWTERFDKELEDIFAIQDEIATEIVRKLELSLFGNERRQPLIHHTTGNAEAYQVFLKGRSYLDQRLNSDAALACFERAVEMDPGFAAAYASIAYAHFYKIVFSNNHPHQSYPKMESAAVKALSLDNAVAEAHNMMGLHAFYYKHDIENARNHYEQSLQLQPNLADTYRIKAYFHSMVLEIAEAIEAAEKAVEIDPMSYNNRLSLADIYYRARRYDEAIRMFKELYREYPDNRMARNMLGNCYLKTGQYALARETYGSAQDLPSSISLYDSGSVVAAFFEGDDQILLRYISYLEQQRESKWISPCMLALLYYLTGDTEKALAFLDKAVEERDNILMVINAEPFWDELKEHPAVRKILRNIGLIRDSA